MKITKIKLENFKSIKSIEFDIKKYGKSYTTMLVGINESGKSNILEAMSFLETPSSDFDYYDLHCQQDDVDDPVDLWFSLEFEYKDTCLNALKEHITNSDLLSFEIDNIIKNVYLQKGETNFTDSYSFDIKKLSKSLFIKKEQKNITDKQGQPVTVETYALSKTKDDEAFQELNLEVFKEIFSENIEKIIKRYTPSISYWKPSEEYLVSEVDLNTFKDDVNANVPLKHIFYIAGMKDAKTIKSEIEKISNANLRLKLGGTLGDKATSYIKKIWDHDIVINVEIAPSGVCGVTVRDGGKANQFNHHKMSARSEGFKQFISLILSLSIEAKTTKRKNSLILIDEPEAHLHPSGIRDLRTELLAIGENNYLFVSTHSPFLVDRKNKDRNVIIRKNRSAATEKVEIDQYTQAIDDEVLLEAFGIEVYKDLLNPHSILVEGATDKQILQKSFAAKSISNYGITNGHGSNVDTLASKLNETGMSVLVILDDDEQGKEYKKRIIKIGGTYSPHNVVTIRDLVGGIVDKGTIEDTLGKLFITSQTKTLFEKKYPGESWSLDLDDTTPFIEQIKNELYKAGKSKKVVDSIVEELKIKIAQDFSPAKGTFAKNFPLLDSLVDAIKDKLG